MMQKHPISELARNAVGLIERASRRGEPIVITKHGQELAVLVPIDLYRKLERLPHGAIAGPRLARPEDLAQFRMTVTEYDPSRSDDP
jgi:prevent-host-death family protein